ncbi:sensor histidine kinase [Lentzea aerocolonigenes]|uniref:sensor histidine kinase n=1 Tax=Lentzea aerocolonigenes TaxID=68170 RepID=UPI0005644E43|nr:HAMP domain-containing sensor histidine kinase [Lentzea aerocolonigenes]MCP2248451.1 two-component system, OmpR family, sensor histidine kinase MtrB [Lentzea aerocolonigenes]
MRALFRGLKPRLMAAFLLLTLLGAVAATGASYATARNLLLEDAQNGFMNPLVDDVRNAAERLKVPPAQQDLDEFQASLRSPAVVIFDGLRSRNGPDPSAAPAEMREMVKSSRTIIWQRRTDLVEPYVVMGIPLLRPDGTSTGVEVWAWGTLGGPQRAIDSFSTAAWVGVSLVLPLALGLALFTARGVLRPVRRLGAAARALGSGRLDTRVDERGSDELADLARTFNRAASQLEASQAAARRFVADVSHELRTPLTAMSAVTAVLDEDAASLPEDTAVAARLVSAETRKLTRLVNDLMEISRFDEGRNVLELDEWDISTAVRDTLAARGWTSSVEASLPDGVVGRVDRRRLDVIVANLVGNALKHGVATARPNGNAPAHDGRAARPDGNAPAHDGAGDHVTARPNGDAPTHGGAGGHVTARPDGNAPAHSGADGHTTARPDGDAPTHGGALVRVTVRPDGIEVADSGPGIPEEALPHIFDRFYKADTARSRSEGSGLGLAIAWENARLHGGTIEAANAPSGGAVFTLRLPW